ncbi:MAG: hypothetical protein J6C26_07670 [Clostridia bacterium]|nr:hypothetical protein [Clostridia bacterium]
MKQFVEILSHIFYCTVLPLSFLCFTIMALPLCFPEGQKVDDYIMHFCIGCLPSWFFALIGYLGLKWKIITVYFARKMMFSHSIAVLVLFCLAMTLGLLSNMKAINALIVFLITLCCLLPRIVLYTVQFVKKKLRKRKTMK